MGKANIITNNFILYGLNRYRNFLHSPTDDYIYLEDEEAVKNFCVRMLHEYPCSDSAIFCVFEDDCMMAVKKVWDEGGTGKYEYLVGKDMHFFAGIDADERLCCYGLMIEVEPRKWIICE
jgi:hypothetical protein